MTILPGQNEDVSFVPSLPVTSNYVQCFILSQVARYLFQCKEKSEKFLISDLRRRQYQNWICLMEKEEGTPTYLQLSTYGTVINIFRD